MKPKAMMLIFAIVIAAIITIGGSYPPSGTHHYQFALYALDTVLNLPAKADKTGLINAINGHILDSATLVGTYEH